MSVTVVITNYLRPGNVRLIIDALCRQTLKPTIFIWDNSPTLDFDDPRVSWMIRSTRNAQCSPRWWMASHAGTEFVVVHDDDLIPSHRKVLAWTIDAAVRVAPFAVGATGVILKPNLNYWQSRHVGLGAKGLRQDTRVDIVKGRYFCCPTARLARVCHLEFDTEDDIAISAKLGNRLQRPHHVLAILQNRFKALPQGAESRKRRANHRAARESACRQFFK